jgi:hypothetical protein
MMEPLTCSAIIRWEPTPFARYAPVLCRQQVGLRGYWAQTRPTDYSGGHYVMFCPIPGHEANVKRRFAPRADVPDPIDEAKREAERRESWTRA